MKILPTFSIITVTLNSEKTIKSTIESVVSQDYPNIEFIIIDGGSRDNTIPIIKKYEKNISYWVSESDNGIFDAMNKGIHVAHGDYVIFIGSDDVLLENSISNFFRVIEYKIIDQLIVCSVAIKGTVRNSIPDISLPVPIIHHQGAVFNLIKLRSIELYSDNFKIHSDFDLICRYVSKFGIHKLQMSICEFSKGGTSTAGSRSKESIVELTKIYRQYGGKIYSLRFLILISRPIYYWLCNIVHKY